MSMTETVEKMTESQAIDRIAKIVEDRTMSPSAIKTYIAILTMIRKGMTVIKREQIAELAGMHGRTVTRAIRELKDAGYIQTKHHRRGQRYTLLK